MIRAFGRKIVFAADTAFLISLPVAAFAFGLTRDSTIHAFNVLIGCIFCLWVTGHILAHQSFRTGRLPWFVAASILIFGWGQAGCGILQNQILLDPDLDLGSINSLFLQINLFDTTLSLPAMIRISALMGAMLIAIHIIADQFWGRLLLLTLLLTAGAMVTLFFLQRLVGEPFLIRSVDGRAILTFATYRYWGNAAAYLNLIWPLAFVVAAYSGSLRKSGWTFFLSLALLAIAALFINISKAGCVLGVTGLLIIMPASLQKIRQMLPRLTLKIAPRYILAIAIPTMVILLSLALAIPWNRWDRMAEKGFEGQERTLAYSYFVRIIPDAGWEGFGPGTFGKVYWPYVENDRRMRKIPLWMAHQDYIQTVIEWGYAGTTLWGIFFLIPGFYLAKRALRRCEPEGIRTAHEGYTFGLRDKLRQLIVELPHPTHSLIVAGISLSLFLTALHALVDFPMQIYSLQLYTIIWIAVGWNLRYMPS